MVSYPGTPGTIELLGLKDAVKPIGREYNTLTRYYRYHLSRPAEKSRYYLSDLFQKEVLERFCIPFFGIFKTESLSDRVRVRPAASRRWLSTKTVLHFVGRFGGFV